MDAASTTILKYQYDADSRLTNTTLFNSTNVALDYIGYAYNNANFTP